MNPDELLERAKDGQMLSDRDLEEVVEALHDGQTEHDPYTLIHVLWKANADRGREVLVSRASDPDEMVRRIALQALRERWPSDEVFRLAVERLRDPSKCVRMVAATTVGALGAGMPTRRAAAARALLQRLGSQLTPEPASAERDAYYLGILELLGVPEEQRPLATRALRSDEIDADVLRRARELASA